MIIVCEHQYELYRPWNEQKRYLIIDSFEKYKQKLLNHETESLSKYALENSSIIKETDNEINIKFIFNEHYQYEFIHEGIIVDDLDLIFKFGEDIIYDAINKKYIHSEEELHESLH